MNDPENQGSAEPVKQVGKQQGGRRIQNNRRYRNPRSRQQSNNYVNQLGDEVEIATQSIETEGVMMTVELKKNNRGKFIKLVDNKNESRRQRIIMSLLCSWQMCDKLNHLIEELKSLPPHNPDDLIMAQKNVKTMSGRPAAVPAYLEGRLKSESIIIENRRYYLDLKENAKGRFVSITLMSQRARAQISLVAEGMTELLSVIRKIIQENCDKNEVEDNNSDLLSQLKSQAFRSERKMFYFDVGANFNGLFCRISEVTPNYRTAITVPETRWQQFRDIMTEYIDISAKFKKERGVEEITEGVDKMKVEENGN